MLLHNGEWIPIGIKRTKAFMLPTAAYGRFVPFWRLSGCDRSHIATFRICR